MKKYALLENKEKERYLRTDGAIVYRDMRRESALP